MTKIFHSRLAMMLVAAVLAIAAAGAVGLYVSRVKTDAQKQGRNVSAVVQAAKDIPAGTSGDDLVSKGYVKSVQVPTSALPTTAITDLASLKGRVASQTIYQGGYLLNEQFPQKPHNLLSIDVKGNYRAVQIPLDHSRGIVGTLKSGDYVDVLASFSVRRLDKNGTGVGDAFPVTVTLMHGVQVLKAPDTGATSGSGSSNNSDQVTATLKATDIDSQRIVFALENAKVWLTLRGDKASDSPHTDVPPIDAKTPQITTLASLIPDLSGYKVVDPTPSGNGQASSNSSPSTSTTPNAAA